MPDLDQLDETNRLLLRELHADPRITMSALARKVGMSAPAVTERVQRMQRTGVITGFSMGVDPAALGLPVAAFVRVRPAARQLTKIAALAESLDQVTECHRITGEDCFLIKVQRRDHPRARGDPRQVPHVRPDRLVDRRHDAGAAEAATGPAVGVRLPSRLTTASGSASDLASVRNSP